MIALRWEPARCSEGDEPDAAGWVGLGSGSTLPFDEDTLGKGEFEGTERPAPSPSATTGDDTPVADLLTGQGADQIKELLATTSSTPTPTTSSGPSNAGSSAPTTSGAC